jgi:hydroxymethylglutaryl-CoA reductase (NADPH)
MLPLWSALAAHAFEHSPAWKDSQFRHIHAHLIADVASWARPLDNGPRTLIHNDFNPRNLVVHERNGELKLCTFDWELATIGLPQRDLAEFLSFVVPESSSRAVVARWIERYRSLLEQESGRSLHRGEWDYGFRAALCDLLVDRLASYAMVDRIRRQNFLPRVVRGWSHLNRYYPWPG